MNSTFAKSMKINFISVKQQRGREKQTTNNLMGVGAWGKWWGAGWGILSDGSFGQKW